jgi:hypothetical protein
MNVQVSPVPNVVKVLALMKGLKDPSIHLVRTDIKDLKQVTKFIFLVPDPGDSELENLREGILMI